jgi:hypothetical protein
MRMYICAILAFAYFQGMHVTLRVYRDTVSSRFSLRISLSSSASRCFAVSLSRCLAPVARRRSSRLCLELSLPSSLFLLPSLSRRLLETGCSPPAALSLSFSYSSVRPSSFCVCMIRAPRTRRKTIRVRLSPSAAPVVAEGRERERLYSFAAILASRRVGRTRCAELDSLASFSLPLALARSTGSISLQHAACSPQPCPFPPVRVPKGEGERASARAGASRSGTSARVAAVEGRGCGSVCVQCVCTRETHAKVSCWLQSEMPCEGERAIEATSVRGAAIGRDGRPGRARGTDGIKGARAQRRWWG